MTEKKPKPYRQPKMKNVRWRGSLTQFAGAGPEKDFFTDITPASSKSITAQTMAALLNAALAKSGLAQYVEVGKSEFDVFSISGRENRCQQCLGKPDRQEYLLPLRGGGSAILHATCWQFYKNNTRRKR
jgi:hypothetical protein